MAENEIYSQQHIAIFNLCERIITEVLGNNNFIQML